MKPLGKTDKPWGYEKIWTFSDREEGYVGKLIHIKENHRLSLQKHIKKEESIIVISGKLKLVLENEVLFLEQQDSFHIQPGVIHRFCAFDGDCTLIEVSTKEIKDIVRIEDDYDR